MDKTDREKFRVCVNSHQPDACLLGNIPAFEFTRLLDYIDELEARLEERMNLNDELMMSLNQLTDVTEGKEGRDD